MYRPRFERVSRLRRFVARRTKGHAGDLSALIAEATRLLLLPSLRDVLDEQGSEPAELRLTYACACVMLCELLAQRFSPRQAEEVSSRAIHQIGTWSGLDDEQLTARVSATIRQLMETHPEVYQGLCSQFDDALQRAIVLGRPAQGEVLTRLALEAFEVTIHRLVLGHEERAAAGLIRSSGLLRVVTLRPPPSPEEPRANGTMVWPFGRIGQRAGRSPRRAQARTRPGVKRAEERKGRQRRRLITITGLVERWRGGEEEKRPDEGAD
jgi:hypothetical protein